VNPVQVPAFEQQHVQRRRLPGVLGQEAVIRFNFLICSLCFNKGRNFVFHFFIEIGLSTISRFRVKIVCMVGRMAYHENSEITRNEKIIAVYARFAGFAIPVLATGNTAYIVRILFYNQMP